MNILIGLAIGLVIGVAQLVLLIKFVARVATGAGFLLLGVLQLFFPFVVLLLVGFLYTAALLWAGIAIAAVLTFGSIFRIISRGRKK